MRTVHVTATEGQPDGLGVRLAHDTAMGAQLRPIAGRCVQLKLSERRGAGPRAQSALQTRP